MVSSRVKLEVNRQINKRRLVADPAPSATATITSSGAPASVLTRTEAVFDMLGEARSKQVLFVASDMWKTVTITGTVTALSAATTLQGDDHRVMYDALLIDVPLLVVDHERPDRKLERPVADQRARVVDESRRRHDAGSLRTQVALESGACLLFRDGKVSDR
jgi:hypothetical protein